MSEPVEQDQQLEPAFILSGHDYANHRFVNGGPTQKQLHNFLASFEENDSRPFDIEGAKRLDMMIVNGEAALIGGVAVAMMTDGSSEQDLAERLQKRNVVYNSVLIGNGVRVAAEEPNSYTFLGYGSEIETGAYVSDSTVEPLARVGVRAKVTDDSYVGFATEVGELSNVTGGDISADSKIGMLSTILGKLGHKSLVGVGSSVLGVLGDRNQLGYKTHIGVSTEIGNDNWIDRLASIDASVVSDRNEFGSEFVVSTSSIGDDNTFGNRVIVAANSLIAVMNTIGSDTTVSGSLIGLRNKLSRNVLVAESTIGADNTLETEVEVINGAVLIRNKMGAHSVVENGSVDADNRLEEGVFISGGDVGISNTLKNGVVVTGLVANFSRIGDGSHINGVVDQSTIPRMSGVRAGTVVSFGGVQQSPDGFVLVHKRDYKQTVA